MRKLTLAVALACGLSAPSSSRADWASITMTLPEMKAVNGCDPSTVPLAGSSAPLDSLFVWGEVEASAARILRAMSVRGWEGASWYVGMACIGDSAAQVWVVTSATNGARSCASRKVGLNGAVTSVPSHAPVQARLRIRPIPISDHVVISWYQEVAGEALLELVDVAGRRLQVLERSPRQAGDHEITVRVNVRTGIAWLVLRVAGHPIGWKRTVVIR